MKQKTEIPLPASAALRKLGEDIRDARRRRRITMALMAERAGISVITLSKIEKGCAKASMGGYASVLYVLGMAGRLRDIADGSHDLTGQMLAAEQLPKRVRIPKN
jgi:DNA-binding XRE family transcriptional regulator